MIEDKVLESDLFEHYQFIADKGQEPLRVDKYLMNRVENATRNKIQNAAKEGSIYVNDKNSKIKLQGKTRRYSKGYVFSSTIREFISW